MINKFFSRNTVLDSDIHSGNGSLFVAALNKIFREKRSIHHIEKMFTLLKNVIHKISINKVRVPYTNSLLTRKLYIK